MSATNFQDDDLPLKFRFLIDQNFAPLFRFSTSNSRTTGLPMPSTYPLSNVLALRVQVQDRFGACSFAESSVVVRLPASIRGRENGTTTTIANVVTTIVTNATLELKQLEQQNGDPSVVLATMRSITSLLNIDSSGSGSSGSGSGSGSGSESSGSSGSESGSGYGGSSSNEDSNDDPTSEDTFIRATARQELFQVLDRVGLALEPTPDNIYLQASVAKELTSNIQEQNTATRVRASLFVVNLVDKQLKNTGK